MVAVRWEDFLQQLLYVYDGKVHNTHISVIVSGAYNPFEMWYCGQCIPCHLNEGTNMFAIKVATWCMRLIYCTCFLRSSGLILASLFRWEFIKSTSVNWCPSMAPVKENITIIKLHASMKLHCICERKKISFKLRCWHLLICLLWVNVLMPKAQWVYLPVCYVEKLNHQYINIVLCNSKHC